MRGSSHCWASQQWHPAEATLEEFAQVWDKKYPTISKSWREKWTDIITRFDFPWPIRKLTQNRKIYPNEDSAFKIIYMAINEASKKWTMPIPKWKPALNHFAIFFENRLPE